MSYSPGTAASGSNRPYFFLSYAHAPEQQGSGHAKPPPFVRTFFDLLCADVMELTGASHPVGFMDSNILIGDSWPSELTDALATCRVFVPLYSIRYFNSERCGREWTAFARRIEMFRNETGQDISAIIPVIYSSIKSDQIPAAIRDIQYKHPNMGLEYDQDGIYGLIKLSTTEAALQHAVLMLAKRIVDVANSTELPTSLRSNYHALTPAFGRERIPGSGRHEVHVAVSALDTSKQLPRGRSNMYYGPSAQDWNPYHPTTSEPVSQHTARMLADYGFQAEIASYENSHVTLIAEEPTAPALVLIDPWSTLKPDRKTLLQELDSLDRPWIRTIIPRGATDSESNKAKKLLMAALRDSLSRTFQNISPDINRSAVAMPETIEKFWMQAAIMFRIASNQYLRRAPTNNTFGPYSNRPKLQGPIPGQQDSWRENQQDDHRPGGRDELGGSE